MRLLLLLAVLVSGSLAASCSQDKGVVYGTGSIKTIQGIKSADDCCVECFNFGYTCAAFTLDTSNQICYLKDNTNGRKTMPDRISGKTGTGPSPGPTPGNRTVATRACQPGSTFQYCNTSLPLEARVDDLISLLRNDEIPALLTAREGGGGSPGPPGNISRIGLPEYDWGVNCIHGVQTTCGTSSKGEPMCPTSFPNPNALGASFNKSAWAEMGQIIGLELRALWLEGATEASSWSGRPHAGLDCWSPNVNINRDPRWGRNQEVPSEDPYINGQFGASYTRGLQNGKGEDPRFLQAVVTLKHWDAYSLEDADGYTRHNFNAVVDNFTLADTYFPAFKESVVSGGAQGMMCSYNALNGVPTCASGFLNKVLRESWKFDGYITGDTGAVEDIYSAHKYSPDAAAASCAALKDGGCDIDSGGVYHSSLLAGVEAKHCSMDDVRKALKRTLGLRFKLGLFDPIEDQPYWHVSRDQVNTTTSQATNLRMTQESLVLLKNENSTLPLSKASKTVAVIGPHYNAKAELVGNYLGEICPGNNFDCVISPVDAIEAKLKLTAGKVISAQGCELTANKSSLFEEAIAAAKQADTIVLAMGIGQSIEGESHDRTDVDLPLVQHQLIAAIRQSCPETPTVLFLLNGGMVDIQAEKGSVPAILEAFYPGFWGGQAIADTLFGDNKHLGGKMPFTVYPADYVKSVRMSDMSMTPNATSGAPGRSYRYFTGTPVYPFGYGIGLTTFKLSNTTNTPSTVAMQCTDAVMSQSYEVTVTNTGDRTGDEVVLAFFKPKADTLAAQTGNNQLIRQLFGFERVHLAPGESSTVRFNVTPSTLQLVDRATGDRVCTPGTFGIEFTNGVDQSLQASVRIEGTERVLEKFPIY